MAISSPCLSSPKSQLWLQRGEVEEHWTSLEKKIRDHPFNYALEVFLPNCSCLQDALSSTPPPYYTSHLSLSHFLQPHLLTQYFHAGEKCPIALTVGRRIDVECVFALTPSGTLMMSVDKDLYEKLGLQGTCSRYQKYRYVVQLDLTAPAFKPGKPGYERVKRRLTDSKLDLKADFVLTWDNTDSAAQDKFMDDFKAKRFPNLEERATFTDLCLPLIRGDSPHGRHDDNGTCCAEEVHTWLGAIACGIEVAYDEGGPGDYISTFTPLQPVTPKQHGIKTRWNGMVTSSHICSILKDIKRYLSADAAGPPWAAVSVWGFEDAPVSWRTNEHGWFLSGDNHYNVIVFKSGQFWILTTLATNDIH